MCVPTLFFFLSIFTLPLPPTNRDQLALCSYMFVPPLFNSFYIYSRRRSCALLSRGSNLLCAPIRVCRPCFSFSIANDSRCSVSFHLEAQTCSVLLYIRVCRSCFSFLSILTLPLPPLPHTSCPDWCTPRPYKRVLVRGALSLLLNLSIPGPGRRPTRSLSIFSLQGVPRSSRNSI